MRDSVHQHTGSTIADDVVGLVIGRPEHLIIAKLDSPRHQQDQHRDHEKRTIDDLLRPQSPDEHDEGKQSQGSELEDLTVGALGDEETESNTQKAAEQDDVGEVREVQNVPSEPTNKCQLDEEHEEAQNDETDAYDTHVVDHGGQISSTSGGREDISPFGND